MYPSYLNQVLSDPLAFEHSCVKIPAEFFRGAHWRMEVEEVEVSSGGTAIVRAVCRFDLDALALELSDIGTALNRPP